MSLIHIIQGLLHADWAAEYGLDATKLSVTARKTLPNEHKKATTYESILQIWKIEK